MRAWLYRGFAYYQLAEMADFNKSIAEAKKANPKELEYIDKVIDSFRTPETAAIPATTTEARVEQLDGAMVD